MGSAPISCSLFSHFSISFLVVFFKPLSSFCIYKYLNSMYNIHVLENLKKKDFPNKLNVIWLKKKKKRSIGCILGYWTHVIMKILKHKLTNFLIHTFKIIDLEYYNRHPLSTKCFHQEVHYSNYLVWLKCFMSILSVA